MSREVRRVPRDWEHPKDERGHYIPMHARFNYTEEEIAEGLRDGWLNGAPLVRGTLCESHYGVLCMPDWPEEQRTHFQMYETVSEGTPISPVCESPEILARWLVDNHASALGRETASYEGWLRVAQGGYAPTGILAHGKFVSGVDGL